LLSVFINNNNSVCYGGLEITEMLKSDGLTVFLNVAASNA